MNRTDNIVLINWGRLAYERNYFESAMYSHKVGNFLGEFMIVLRNSRFITNFRTVHMIGLGLGAQVAAAASHYMKERAGGLPIIGRITGLLITAKIIQYRITIVVYKYNNYSN